MPCPFVTPGNGLLLLFALFVLFVGELAGAPPLVGHVLLQGFQVELVVGWFVLAPFRAFFILLDQLLDLRIR